jgi:GNAT superfamily N-acetyltransferase
MTSSITGYGYTWWRGDLLPVLQGLEGLRCAPENDTALLAGCTGLEPVELERRAAGGSQAYLAWLDGIPAGWGWSASRTYRFYGQALPLAPGERALWDFATLPARRGRGIYPRLLQAILRIETGAERFWIGHAAGNAASQSGILKAGFQLCTATRLESGQPRILALGPDPRPSASPMGRVFGI